MSLTEDTVYLVLVNTCLFLGYVLFFWQCHMSSTQTSSKAMDHRQDNTACHAQTQTLNDIVLPSTQDDVTSNRCTLKVPREPEGSMAGLNQESAVKRTGVEGSSNDVNRQRNCQTDQAGTYHQVPESTEKTTASEVKALFPDLTVLDLNKILLIGDLPPLGSAVIAAPSTYVQSLPAKGVRDNIIDSLNCWLNVPEMPTLVIKRVVGLLHEASLMLDDIQDSSPLRRAMPAAHTVFGHSQTIHSASYNIIQAVEEMLKLGSIECLNILLEELKVLYIGQSWDLYWTCNLECPSVEEYLKSVDSKTGGLFRLLLRLMDAMSLSTNKPNLRYLIILLGRHFGIRDDYQNLRSDEYEKKKGFCEDLDEGKYSLPIIHTLHSLGEDQGIVLRSLLAQRHINGRSSLEHKQLVLGLMERSGSLNYTLAALRQLQSRINQEVDAIEKETGVPNYLLKVQLTKFYV